VAEQFVCASSVPGLRYHLAPPEHRGLTRQRNFGVQRATGEIISFLDDDTVPDADYFSETLACFARHPEALAVGGRIANETVWRKAGEGKAKSLATFRFGDWERSEGLRRRLRRLLGLESPLPPGWMPPFGHGRSADFPPDGLDHAVEYVMGGVSSWRRRIFAEQQFSKFFSGYGLYEDLDFCVRAAARGKLYVCTRATVAHYHAPGARPNQFRYGAMVVRNGWFVWRRRWPEPAKSDRWKWWATTAVLTLCRAWNGLAGPGRVGALTEAAGRCWGMAAVFVAPPRGQLKED
jgi:GT2 family glycosyltransferase